MLYKDLKSLYRGNIKEITKSVDNWKDYLTFASKVHKYSFDNALLIYLQNKEFTTMATYEQWNKLGRYVNTGATGLKVCQYDNARATYKNLFDISQTNGKELNITNWNLDDYTKSKLVELYGGANFEDLVSSGVVHLTIKKLSTIIEEIKSDPNHIFGQLSEDIIYGELTDILVESSYYLVSKRCGLSDEEIKLQDKMHSVVDFNNMKLIATLGQAVTSISKSLLIDMERKIKIIEKERNVQNEQSREITERESNKQHTVQTGREETSIPSNVRDDGRRTKTTNEIWQNGNDTYGRKLSEQINGTETNGQIDESVARSGRKSVQQSFGIDGRIESEKSNAENGEYFGKNKTSQQLETNSRRNSNTRDGFNLSLEEKEQINNKLKLEPITLGESEVIGSFSAFNEKEVSDVELNKIVEKELVKVEKNISNNMKKGKTREHLNFYKLQKLFPEFIDGKYSYLKLKSESSAYMDLVLEKVSDDTISIAHYYEQNGDLMRDPEITLIVDYEKNTVTAESFTQDNIGLYQRAFNEDRTKWNKNLNKELNSFLKDWLKNIESQGYSYYKTIETKIEKEIVLDENILLKKDEMFEWFKTRVFEHFINNELSLNTVNESIEQFKTFYNDEVEKCLITLYGEGDEQWDYIIQNETISNEFKENTLKFIYDKLSKRENEKHDNDVIVSSSSEKEQDYSYLIGKTVKLNGKPFLIDSLEPYDNAVNLEDVEFKTETGVPLFREEPLEKILRLLEEEKIESIEIDNTIKV